MKFIKKTMCAVLIFGSCCKPAFSESYEGLCKSQKTQVSNWANSVDVEKKKSVYQKEGIIGGIICADRRHREAVATIKDKDLNKDSLEVSCR